MRRLLLAGLAIVLLLCGGGVAAGMWLWERTSVSTVGTVDFDHRLDIPPLAPSRVDDHGRRVFDLRAQVGQRDFGRGGGRTHTWGFNGDYLGPTLRASRGEEVVVNVHNGLNEATSVHWHGMHLPARMDGGPHQEVPPRATWSPTWRVAQPAATLWYHPHPHGRTESHVYRGLAGMFIVDAGPTQGQDAATAPLPHRYGVDDVPVIVQDKRFRRDGEFDPSHRMFSDIGVLGDTVLVNGTVGPYHEVTTERVRLRLLNASTARIYRFALSTGQPFALVGTDGGLLPAAVDSRSVQLSPGERAEIVVTMRPGEQVTLRSDAPSLGDVGVTRFAGGGDSFDVLQLRAAATLAASPPVPVRLASVPRLDPAQVAQRRTFVLAGRRINGDRMDMDRVDAVVTKDTTEVWRVRNGHDTPHSFHVHDVQFQVLSVDGARPPAYLGGWKDTVYLPPHTEIAIIARFADYADPTAPYMFHCHVLLHEDQGMMGQFVVVEKGQRPAVAHHHG